VTTAVLTYIALLRGINLGSHNKVPMPALRALAEDLGYADVSTYIQSGNVILTSSESATKVASALAKGIAAEFGIDIAVLVRTKQQLQKVVDGNPFLKQGNDPGALHIVFLSAKPRADKVKALTAKDLAAEEVAVNGTEAYLHLPNGYGRAKLNNAFVEKQLGVAGTTRNWRTTAKLLELAGA
jgi:uncharacterized protein (DUF1697 family)